MNFESKDSSLISVKNQLIDLLLITSGILGAVSLFILTYPIENFFKFKIVFAFISIGSFFGLYIYRKSIELSIKSAYLIFVIFILTFSDVYEVGVTSSNILLITIIPFISTLVYSSRVTVLLSILCLICYIIFAFLFITAQLVYQPESPLNSDQFKWVDTAFITIIVTIVYSVFMGKFNVAIQNFINDIQESNLKLQLRDKDLLERNHEKSILLQEIHHRVKNNLAVVSGLLQLQLFRINDSESRFILQKSTNRIMSIAKVHEMLYESENFDKIQFEQYLRELTTLITDSMDDLSTDVLFEYDIKVDSIDMHLGVPLGIIVNELITNSFKYGFTPSSEKRIKIEIFSDENRIFVEYSDSGVGIENFEIASQKGLGFTLIKSLLEQIEAEYRYETTDFFKLSFNFLAKQPSTNSVIKENV
jgi:two-component sensor histidine kinase